MILEPSVMCPVVGNAVPDGSKCIAFGYQALELTPGTRSTARSSIIESASEPNFDPTAMAVQVCGKTAEFAVFEELARRPSVTLLFPRNQLPIKDLR
jgi:hypothetical protein